MWGSGFRVWDFSGQVQTSILQLPLDADATNQASDA